MLIAVFKYLMDTMPRNSGNLDTLRTRTVYGTELTKTASIAKMNMILAGDGHNNIHRRDSLGAPRRWQVRHRDYEHAVRPEDALRRAV